MNGSKNIVNFTNIYKLFQNRDEKDCSTFFTLCYNTSADIDEFRNE